LIRRLGSEALVSESEHRTPRVPLRVKVEYDVLDDFLDDYTANISMGGMFVRSDTPMPLDTTFRIRFSLPGRATPLSLIHISEPTRPY